MPTIIHLQNNSKSTHIPLPHQFQHWVEVALSDKTIAAEITIRLVDEEESAQLNQLYRRKNGATNVLSFPFEAELDIDEASLGDLVICAPIIKKEAVKQHKTLTAHWAHIVIHGILHLLGYDHVNEDDALIMENLEINYLQQLGFHNPYT